MDRVSGRPSHAGCSGTARARSSASSRAAGDSELLGPIQATLHLKQGLGPETLDVTLTDLRQAIDDEFFILSEAYYERYIGVLETA